MESVTQNNNKQENNLIKKIASPEMMAEGLAGSILVGIEMMRDKTDNSMTNPHGLNLTSVPQGTVENWAFSHVGDIAEVSLLFGATRVALASANEVLNRTTGKKIPDEACFWASMVTSVTIPSLIELNVIHLSSLGDKLSSVSDPADLFGVGVAAIGIATAHYISKYREPITKLVSPIVRRGIEKSKRVISKIKEANEKMMSSEFFSDSVQKTK
jgi:hypothetical protein